MALANELRIGNWVYKNNKKGFKSYFRIDNPHDIEKFYYGFDQGEGIPITLDILRKMGAENFGDGESLILYGRLISYAECRKIYYDKSTSVDLLFVHQYQNLIFSLTGQEININLDPPFHH